MAKGNSKFICQQCGYESVGYLGKCPNCGEWNSMVETVVSAKSVTSNTVITSITGKKTVKLSEIKIDNKSRTSTKISELDRVLGGGVVSGQVILIAGEPGIGKSTLLLELSNNLENILYVCGEESASQVAIRAQRLGVKNKNINLLENTDVDQVCEQSTENSGVYKAIIVDSIQTMTTTDLSGMAGAVGQVKECASRLVRLAKNTGIPVFIVGHVTKEGTVAGPSVLAHIVDTVLWFEGESQTNLRVLRSIKNRFGPTDEVGIFEMVDSGIKSVTDSQKIFLSEDKKGVSGSAVASIMQGTRPILVEIQALVVDTKLAFPRRIAQGIDQKRLEVIIAVLTRRCGLPLYGYDVFVNVSGGIKVTEPGSDLAVALAITSSYFDKALPAKTVAIGEIGLLGEIRDVSMQEKRTKEAVRLGYKNVISNKQSKYLSQIIKSLK